MGLSGISVSAASPSLSIIGNAPGFPLPRLTQSHSSMKDNKRKTKHNLRLIAGFLEGSTHFFVLCIFSSLLASLMELICPKIISYTVDSVLGGEALPAPIQTIADTFGGTAYLRGHLWLIAGMILVVALFMGLFKYGEAVYNRKGSETLVETMRNRLFYHLERLPSAWYSDHQTGDIIQRCTSDVETVKAFLSEQLTSIISTVLLIVMSLFFMYSVNATLATAALVSIPVIVLYSAFFHGKIGILYCDETEGKLSAIVQENLTGVRVVRAFGREQYEVEKFTNQNNLFADAWIKLGKVMSFFWSSGDFISGLQVMVILVWGTVLAAHGKMTVGEFIAIVSYTSMLTWPVRSLGRVISEMSKAGISIGRIGEIMDAEEEHDAPDAVDCDTSGDIVFDNVTFAYPNSDEVLKNINLTVKKGETLGIIGMTGSGKSTLVSLLCRLYELPEDSGTISVSGTDIRKIKAHSLRENIGIVLQEPFLFSRTLRDNIGITYDKPGEHEVEIREAARAACLDTTIEGFTEGYNTMVGERGVTLSGGQKQRTAIARLLTEMPPVMIFDDSLSAVDAETDANIRKALREKTADATVILISHRIQTLMTADHIIVMAGGEIVEEGTHEELIRRGGIYQKINDIQTGVEGGEQ